MMTTMNLFTCIGLFFLVATVCAQFKPIFQKSILQPVYVAYVPPETPPPTETSPYCSNGTCAGVSYEEILKLYGDLFYTEEELQRKLLDKEEYTEKMQESEKWSWIISHRIRKLRTSPDHNGDRCCPTKPDFLFLPTMKNIRGQTRIVVCLKDLQPFPMYQLIQRGKCMYTRTAHCTKCKEDYAIHNILVVDQTSNQTRVVFDEFYVPSCCSCKG